ncbi:MAG: hypothetical protein HZB13_14600 [Acidobacteria bacterium]|nr:hypothetical protein [Acidobacteriota bacterium]
MNALHPDLSGCGWVGVEFEWRIFVHNAISAPFGAVVDARDGRLAGAST